MAVPEDTSFARLVSLACHDLRTPLATAHGFAKTLIRLGGLEPPRDRYVEIMSEATQQLGDLIDLLSLAARVESGRYEPDLRDVDSAELAQTAAGRIGNGRASVRGSGSPVRVEPVAAETAVFALAYCALRHGGLEAVTLTVDGAEIAVAPIVPGAAAIVLGQDLRDLGAAVAVRLVAALGGSTELDGDVLRVRLPAGGGS
jgi:signal transduction histidine kinase